MQQVTVGCALSDFALEHKECDTGKASGPLGQE